MTNPCTEIKLEPEKPVWHNNWTIRKMRFMSVNEDHEPDEDGWIIEHFHPYENGTHQILSMPVQPSRINDYIQCWFCKRSIEPVEIKKLILLNRP